MYQIPDDDPAAFVKASVPGTREAQDAVLLASIPSSTTVQLAPVTETVTYSGAPQFVAIPSTTVQYAVNTPNQVFLVSGGYYWCYGGAWLTAPTPSGPWTYCTSVPSAIYTIPPSNPNYNVTYVVVQSSTPTTVVYSQTAGYSGQYVAATGVLMFGMGVLVGAAIADHHDNYYHYPPPCHYSYGCGAVYHYGGGGYYASAHVSYGPYGGAGRTASYNPATGTYARSSYAYGPYGSASRGAAYNPYTGTSAAGRTVSTPYGSARQGAAYNPYTGARAAGGQVNTAYGSAGRGAAYNPTTGQGAAGRYASGAYGSAGAVRTTEGSGMVAWDTKNGQGAVGKTRSGDVYAAKDGTVYKKDSGGGWSQNTGSGWQSTAKSQSSSYSGSGKPQTSSYGSTARPQSTSATSSSWSQNKQSLESQSQARQSRQPANPKSPVVSKVFQLPRQQLQRLSQQQPRGRTQPIARASLQPEPHTPMALFPAPGKAGTLRAVLRGFGLMVRGGVLLLPTLWAAAALYFDVRVPWLRLPLAAVYMLAVLAVWVLIKRPRLAAGLTAGAFVLVLAWWCTLQPSNDRDWQPDVAVLPYADINGNRILLHNIRNCDYRTEHDFDVRRYDKTFDLAALRAVDLFMVYWGSPNIAHTMVSFVFEGGDFLCFSIEARKEKGEGYSTLKGLFRQFELVYVAADERDLVRLRTNYRQGEEAYLFRLNGSPETVRVFFLDYLRRMNSLTQRPEWYSAFTHNCTTSIRTQRAAADRAPWDWRILFNGHGDELLYERGLIASNLPLAELKERCHINARARAAGQAADFSRRIRQGVPGIAL